MTRSRALALVVITLLAAAVLRFPDLTEIPPGPHRDEAANGLLAAGLDPRSELVPSGKEPLYFYLTGSVMGLLGETLFTLRLTSALLGILTVAATYRAGRELLADRRVALIASVLLGVSFWHLLVSRLGFRAVGLPLIQALAVAALFRGLKRDADVWVGVGGILSGLTVYVYPAAWFFLLALVLALLPLLAGRPGFRRATQLFLFLGMLLLVIAPLLLSFLRQSGAGQPDLPFAVETVPGFLEEFFEALGLVFLIGDPSWHFNLPGRPLFNWFWGGLLLAGWVISLRHWRRWWYDWQKAAVLLLLLVPLIMLLPVALTVGENASANLRAVGLIPFVFYLPALSLVTLVEQLADRFRGRDEEGASFLRALSLLDHYDVNYTFLALFILLLGTLFTGRQYFQSWATADELFYASDADLAALAPVLDTVSADAIYVAAEHYGHATIRFLSERSGEVKWLRDGRTLALLPDAMALYFYPLSTQRPPWATSYLEEDPNMVGPAGPDGQPTFVAFAPVETPAPVPESPLRERFANFGNVAQLTAYRVGSGQSGGSVPLLLTWDVVALPPAALRPFFHLYDSWDNLWIAAEADDYLASQWSVGETVLQQIELPLPPGMPPGTYHLYVGFFDPANAGRLPHLDPEGRYAGVSLDLADVDVTAGEPPPTLPKAPRGKPEMARPALTFLGFDRNDEPVPAGRTLPLALWWHATAPQPPLTVRLVLTRADNTGIILLDTRPVHQTYPFPQWPAAQFVIDQIDPRVPSGLAAGNYRLELSLLTEEGERVFSTDLGPLTVIAGDRSFAVPPLSYPLSASFAGEIELVGYDLVPAADGQYTLSLAWQALQAPAADYVAEVGLQAEDRTCCLWQEVRELHAPASSSGSATPYATGRWLPGEVVLDSYSVRLPPASAPGVYPLAVGLRRPDDGRPVQVSEPGLPPSDVVYLRPLTVEP